MVRPWQQLLQAVRQPPPLPLWSCPPGGAWQQGCCWHGQAVLLEAAWRWQAPNTDLEQQGVREYEPLHLSLVVDRNLFQKR